MFTAVTAMMHNAAVLLIMSQDQILQIKRLLCFEKTIDFFPVPFLINGRKKKSLLDDKIFLIYEIRIS